MDELAPLYVVAGAPGAGKTTVLPTLAERSRATGGPVVMDMDEVLEDGSLLGVRIADPTAAPIWPAYDRLWIRIVDMVRRAGHPVLLLTPTPDPTSLPGEGSWSAPVRWALLDCADDVRIDRLRERGWCPEQIAEARTDSAAVRPLAPTVITTDDSDVEKVANRILGWTTAATR